MNRTDRWRRELTRAVAIALPAVVGACIPSHDQQSSFVGCWAPSIGPIVADESGPRWVMLDSVMTRNLPQPRPQGRFVARLPAGYQPDFIWYGGWEPLGADSIKIDWNRTGEWIELRLAFQDTVLAGNAVVSTDILDSVRSYPVFARSVPCD